MQRPLRLVVFDVTQQARPPRALGYSWRFGTALYRTLGRVDAAYGAGSFGEAFSWLARHEPARPIGELQFWGHGKWGGVFVNRDVWDRSALSPRHPLRKPLEAFRERLTAEALIWFRTCETLGARAGQDFASALGDFTGARIAGHTFVIGYFQSGVHLLRPGHRPRWSTSEGLARGSPDRPELALASGPTRPNTITCLTGAVPERFADPPLTAL